MAPFGLKKRREEEEEEEEEGEKEEEDEMEEEKNSFSLWTRGIECPINVIATQWACTCISCTCCNTEKSN